MSCNMVAMIKVFKSHAGQIDEYNTAIMIGERSLDKGKPI